MLQSLEGQIALDLMEAGANEGIVVLPVHDSFITTIDKEEWLWNQMINQWAINVSDRTNTKVEKKNR